jgi:hypothetical protein
LLRVEIERPSGRLIGMLPSGRASPSYVPRYLVVPDDYPIALGLRALPITASVYLPLELERFTGPPRVDWSTAGTSILGVVAPGKPAFTTVYAGALATRARRCATFSLGIPGGTRSRSTVPPSVAARCQPALVPASRSRCQLLRRGPAVWTR